MVTLAYCINLLILNAVFVIPQSAVYNGTGVYNRLLFSIAAQSFPFVVKLLPTEAVACQIEFTKFVKRLLFDVIRLAKKRYR